MRKSTQRTRNAQHLLRSTLAVLGTMLLLAKILPTAAAQIAPSQPPIDTTLGGTGAARVSLQRVAGRSGVRVIQKLRGPEQGWGRARSAVEVHPLTREQLPGVEGYFLRSSYVTLDPGGVSPIHTHSRRPAFLQVISGTVHQHRSDGVSFIMGPGDFTFSSDELAHWWINEDPEVPMKLWVVELCSLDHGCKTAVTGGAMVTLNDQATTVPFEESATRQNSATAKTIMEIDLAGEFKDAMKLGDRRLRLRRIVFPPGSSLPDQGPDLSLTYFRVASGELMRRNSQQENSVKAGSIVLAKNAPTGPHWSNTSETKTVVYAVDIFNPDGK